MSLYRDQSVARVVLRILAVTSIVTLMSIYSLRSCQNKFSRSWETKEIVIGNASLCASLSVDRLHDEAGNGKYGKNDEMQYKLSIEEVAVDKNRPADFLNIPCNTHPDIFFVNRDAVPIFGPIHLQLQQAANAPGTWTAEGSLAYPVQMRHARDWYLQFESNVEKDSDREK